MSNKPESWIWLKLLTETSLQDKQQMYPENVHSKEESLPRRIQTFSNKLGCKHLSKQSTGQRKCSWENKNQILESWALKLKIFPQKCHVLLSLPPQWITKVNYHLFPRFVILPKYALTDKAHQWFITHHHPKVSSINSILNEPLLFY